MVSKERVQKWLDMLRSAKYVPITPKNCILTMAAKVHEEYSKAHEERTKAHETETTNRDKGSDARPPNS